MSQRIIDWRTQNGRFTAVEDLMSVTGVGEKTFEELKDLVTV
jgi:competence protein ComEA